MFDNGGWGGHHPVRKSDLFAETTTTPKDADHFECNVILNTVLEAGSY